MSAGTPKGWPKSDGANYGIPKPVFVIPAAYVNKQAAEWPAGHVIDPCIIPPPEVTLAGGILTIGGTSIVLAGNLKLTAFYVIRNTLSGPELVTRLPSDNSIAATAILTVENVGQIPAPHAKIIVNPLGVFSNGTFAVAYSGGATGPATIDGTVFVATGLEVNIPVGGRVDISGVPYLDTPTFYKSSIQNNWARVYSGNLIDLESADNYQNFILEIYDAG